MTASFALQIKDRRWDGDDVDWPGEIDRILPLIMEAAGCQGSAPVPGGEICLVFTNDTELQGLNKSWRGMDRPTNVLSFPASADGPEAGSRDPVLGDVIFARDTITREAREQHKTFRNHMAHLIIHGVLHLLGYDHETGQQADHMETLERKILARLDIADPYQD